MWVKAWKKASSPKLEKILLHWRKTMKRCGWTYGLLGWGVVLYLCLNWTTLNVVPSSRSPALHLSQNGNHCLQSKGNSRASNAIMFLEKKTAASGRHRNCWGWGRGGRLWRWILSSYADLVAPTLAHCWVRPARLPHELAIWDWWGEPKRAAFQQLSFLYMFRRKDQELWCLLFA